MHEDNSEAIVVGKRDQSDEERERNLPAEPRAPCLRIRIHNCQFEVTERRILGRNGDIAIEQFREDLSTARQHAELYHAHGRWWVRNLCRSGSPCVFDGHEIAPGEAVVVGNVGDLLLGTKGFVVHLEQPESVAKPRGALEGYLHGKNTGD
jgi:hypothetical protein